MTEIVQGSEVEIVIDKLVAGGDGFGRVDGLPVFVPRTAPGDRVRVMVTDRRRDYARAAVVEVLEPGRGRREPPCPHFSECGGCHLQHIEDDLQVEFKVAAVRETLERLGGIKLPEGGLVVSGEPFAYRLRTGVRLEQTAASGIAVGYRARGSWDHVPIERCPVLAPALERAVLALGPAISGKPPKRIDLALGDDDRVTASPPVDGFEHGEVAWKVGEYRYAFDARSFFQGHVGLLEGLVTEVVGEDRGELAWDLYSGVGLFTLPLAARYGSVVAVEGDTGAVRYAKINARRNRLKNIEVVSGSVDTRISGMPTGVDRVVADPPRAGMGTKVVEGLLERRPARITYVSCHAAALARDLRKLGTAYAVESIAMFDLFPQTGHLEVVAQLRLET